jgi:hypothetical protein
MSNDLLHKAVQKAGLDNAFSVVDLDEFLAEIERVGAEAVVDNDGFHRFLEAIVVINILPATWQKLADMGWDDGEIAALVDAGLIVEDGATLISAINSGALALREFNEFATYPNQEVEIFYFTPEAQDLVKWLQGQVTMPKIGKHAYNSK